MIYNHVSYAYYLTPVGTSLQVAPFNFLVQCVPRTVPMVLINRDINTQVFGGNPNLLFLQGDIEEQIEKLMQDVDWELEKYDSATAESPKR